MTKTKPAYKVKKNGENTYFTFNLAGFNAIREMSHRDKVNYTGRYCRVPVNTKLIGE